MAKYEVYADRTKLLPKGLYTEGRGKSKVKYIVIHYNAGDLSLDGCYDVLKSRKVSAHYQVDSKGKTAQYVYDSNTAYHAGVWAVNQASIGIEHANRGLGTTASFTPETLIAGAKLVGGLCYKFKLGKPEWFKNVYPHHHFKATSCPGTLDKKYADEYIKYAQDYYKLLEGVNK